MILLKNTMKLKGLKGAEELLSSSFFKGYLKRHTPLKVRMFLDDYLSYSFDASLNDPFKVLDYADLLLINDKMLAESEYFKTMPNEYLSKLFEEKSTFFKSQHLPEFYSLLLNKVTKKEDIEYFLGHNFTIPGLPDKILSFKDIDLVIKSGNKISKDNFKELIKNVSNNFSVSELKSFCLNVNILSPKELLEVFKNDLSCEGLNALYDVVILNSNNKDSLKNNYFNDFIKEVTTSKYFQVENLQYFAKRILETKNIEHMKKWVFNTTCVYNYKIIETLIAEIHDITELSELILEMENYHNWTLKKLYELNPELYLNVINRICEISPKKGLALNGYRNIKLLSKENLLNLVSLGEIKTRYVFDKFELSEKERLELLKSLLSNNSDALTLYGPYLLTGNKMMLPNKKEIENGFSVLESIRNR